MNSVYCTSCGSKIEYSYPKPKFCSSCGTNLSPDNSPQIPQRTSNSEVISEDETNATSIPNMSKLDFDVDYGMPSIIKGGDLIENPSAPQPKLNRTPPKSNNTQSNKDIIMDSMNECRPQSKPTDVNG